MCEIQTESHQIVVAIGLQKKNSSPPHKAIGTGHCENLKQLRRQMQSGPETGSCACTERPNGHCPGKQLNQWASKKKKKTVQDPASKVCGTPLQRISVILATVKAGSANNDPVHLPSYPVRTRLAPKQTNARKRLICSDIGCQNPKEERTDELPHGFGLFGRR